MEIPSESLRFSLIDDVYTLGEEWDELVHENIFFQSSFLSIIQDSPLDSIRQYYVKVYSGSALLGIVVLQVKHFQLKESLRQHKKTSNVFKKIGRWIKYQLSGLVDYKIMVVGNLLLTGNYGFYFKGNLIPENEKQVIDKAVDFALAFFKKRKIKISGILLKDYNEALRLKPQSPIGNKYIEFKVQPGMHMDIRPNWKNMEAYMSDMKSKYRVRIKSALKAIEPIDKKILTLEEIQNLESTLHQLYTNVSEGARFNMFHLKPDYFYQLKSKLRDKVEIVGYFLEDKLVGFYSAIENNGHLDAHFLGYDPAYNRSLKLYLNMLIGLVSFAIEKQMACIQMSRTAMAIKSSVGAIPTEYYLYLNARGRIKNKLAARFLAYFIPEDPWEARHPFK